MTDIKIEELRESGFKLEYKNGEFWIRRPFSAYRKISAESLVGLINSL